jgi:hypothetical protein
MMTNNWRSEMIQDQNAIVLLGKNGYHEEYTLDPAESGLVLPGSIVAVKSPRMVSSQTEDLSVVEPLIVKENALIGGTINRPSRKGEVIMVQRGVSGDRYLVRAVPGSYRIGDPVYVIQTANGIYVSKENPDDLLPFAIADEDFTFGTNIVDLKDESTTDGFGHNEVPNGGIVNLLKVRLA